MEWNKVLEYEEDVISIAKRFASRFDPSLLEDSIQHCYIVMAESVDINKSRGPEKDYVKGAIWNILQKFFISNMEENTSLQDLINSGVQIDTSRDVVWPSQEGSYKGDYRE